MNSKNLRLLGLEESPGRQPTLQEIIDELRQELSRGEAVYTTDELARLRRKLVDYEQMLHTLMMR